MDLVGRQVEGMDKSVRLKRMEPEVEEDNLRIFATTMQKSGTNLLAQLIGNGHYLPYARGHVYKNIGIATIRPENLMEEGELIDVLYRFSGFLYGHLPFDEKFVEPIFSTKTYFIQLIRDPRDIAVSQLHMIFKNPNARGNWLYPDGSRLSDHTDPLLKIIGALPQRWASFLPWMDYDWNHVVRFEDLIKYPGSVAERLIKDIGPWYCYKLNLGDDIGAWMLRIKPHTSPTFRRGIVGEWKETFEPHHVKEFERIMKPTMERLGYEL